MRGLSSVTPLNTLSDVAWVDACSKVPAREAMLLKHQNITNCNPLAPPCLVLPVSFWFLQTSTWINGFVKALETMRLQGGYTIVYVCVYVEWKVLKWTSPSHFGFVCNEILFLAMLEKKRSFTFWCFALVSTTLENPTTSVFKLAGRRPALEPKSLCSYAEAKTSLRVSVACSPGWR